MSIITGSIIISLLIFVWGTIRYFRQPNGGFWATKYGVSPALFVGILVIALVAMAGEKSVKYVKDKNKDNE